MGKFRKTLLLGLASILVVGVATGCGKDAKKQEEKHNSLVETVSQLQTNGETKEFEGLIKINLQTLESHTGLNANDVEEAFGQLPAGVDSSFYLVIKPKSGNSKFGGTNKDRVKTLVGNYISSLKTRLGSELPVTNEEEEVDETEKARREAIQKKITMLDNVKIEETKGYIIYISSSDNAKVLSAIKKGL